MRKGGSRASELAEYLNRNLVGSDFEVLYPAATSNVKNQSIIYLEGTTLPDMDNLIQMGFENILFLTSEPLPNDQFSYILSDNPKYDFVTILHEFFVYDVHTGVHERALVEKEAVIERNVQVGANSYIGADVTVGRNTIIMNNVVVSGLVSIGSDCVIKDNTVIGSEGYGFVYDHQNIPIHIPQLGAILIGNKVWIGSNTTVERAELKDTVISSDVKIDDLVHIGGGSHISTGCMITAATILGRNVNLGKNCWLSPNVSVSKNTTIEDNVVVGQGSVVLRDLIGNGVYVGIPAKFLRHTDESE